MKKILLTSLAVLFGFSAMAQDFDTDPKVKIDNEKEDLHFKIGARMISDVAWYHSDFTPLKSGAALVDSRIRAGLNYKNWYFFADMGFTKSGFKQKHIFLQYTAQSSPEHRVHRWYM